MAPPSWVEVIYVIPLCEVSRGLNLNLSSVGGRSLELTDYYRAEARRYLPDRLKTEARPCEAEARPSQLKKLPRGRLEPRQMPRGLYPWVCQRWRSDSEHAELLFSLIILAEIDYVFLHSNIERSTFSVIGKVVTKPRNTLGNIQLTATIIVVFEPTIQGNVSFILNFIAGESATDFLFTRSLHIIILS